MEKDALIQEAKTNAKAQGDGKGSDPMPKGQLRPGYQVNGKCNVCWLVGHKASDCPSLGKGFKGKWGLWERD